MDASWNRYFRFFSDFWNRKSSHVGSKMYSKIDLILKTRRSRKYCKTNIILRKSEASRIEKSHKNRSKNEAKMGIALGIDFSWIFMIWGSKLEPSWNQKSTKKRSKKASTKMMANKRRLGSVLGPSWPTWVGGIYRPGEGGEYSRTPCTPPN